MMKPVSLIILLWFFCYVSPAQQGCTDPNANNYNSGALINNGSCTYTTTTVHLPLKTRLNTQVSESSGLVYIREELWTFNDSDNAAALFRINPENGNVLRTVAISNTTNIDWEDITADNEYLYIGDFGNNLNGNRQDLKIYKIRIADLYADPALSVTAEVINFSYADQTDFTPRGNFNTEFDCEAFFVLNDQLHLFSKDWVGPQYHTKHYVLPTTTGIHTAILTETFNVGGAVSGADIAKDNINEIMLIGYNPANGGMFMWLLFDYQSNMFFNGNKRRIELNSIAAYGLIEGVTYIGSGVGYISSEMLSIPGITVPASLYTFTSVNWVPLPVDIIKFTATYHAPDVHISWQTASETASDYFIVERSVNGVDFEQIHRQTAAGISRSLRSYSYTDSYSSRGTNYYRLKQTDLDGKFTYSTVEAVQAGGGLTFSVSPVPVRKGEALSIKYSGSSGNVNILLRTLSGNILLQENDYSTKMQELVLQTALLQPGLYIIQIADAQQVLTRKVLVL